MSLATDSLRNLHDMALYDDQLATHPVWGYLAAAHEALAATTDKLADPEQIEIHAHIGTILTYLEERLNTVDAQLIPFGPVDGINSNLSQLDASLRQFNENPGNRGILDQADAQAVGVLNYLAQLPLATPAAVENLREIGARYRRSMSTQVGLLSREVNALRAAVEEVQRVATERETQMEAEIGRLDQAVDESRTAFDAAQGERESGFKTQLEDFESRITGPVDEAAAAADRTLRELQERADTTWTEISALKQRAETASNYLGINAMAGGYHTTANAEERRAFWLRVGAIGCFAGAIGASIFALVYHVVTSFSLDGFLTKAAVALPFLLLAGYLAREASQHHERAHFNRQRQRQLESLPAYVDGLEPQQRANLYEELAPGFFSPPSLRAKRVRKVSEREPSTDDGA